MKRILFTLLTFVLPVVTIAQVNKTSITKTLETLLDQKEYFRLDTYLKSFKENLNEGEKFYYQCFDDNAFNQNNACITDVDKIFKITSFTLPDSAKAALLLLQADSYFKQFQYAKAAHNDSIVLSQYASSLENSMLRNTENDLSIAKALLEIAPQEIYINNGTTIKWENDRMGLINIPATINNQTVTSIFDTKANLSCITRTYAKKAGIKIIDTSVESGSVMTGIRFKNALGIADSLHIGDILLKNVVFLVMPDEKLRFGFFSIHAIIGYPVIEQLNEIQFYKDGRMIVPEKATKTDLHNLALDGPNPVLSLKAGDDTLCFNLDLGAQQTRLYATYFERYKETIEKEGKKTTMKLGGAGGSVRKDIYLIPELDLSVDNKNVTLHKVTVFTKKLSLHERFYGLLGEDFIHNLDKFVINFRSMYFQVN